MKRMETGKLTYNLELQFDECYAAKIKQEEEMVMNKGRGPSSFFSLLLCIALTK